VVLIRHLFNPILSQKSAVRQYQILPILTDRFNSAVFVFIKSQISGTFLFPQNAEIKRWFKFGGKR